MAKLFWHQLPRLLKQDQVELVLVSRSCGLPILYARQQDVLMPIHRYGRGQLPSLPLDQLYPRLRSLGVRRIQWWQYVTADEACAGRPQPVVQWLAF